MDDAQPVLFTQLDDPLGQVGVANTAAELAVENIDRRLA